MLATTLQVALYSKHQQRACARLVFSISKFRPASTRRWFAVAVPKYNKHSTRTKRSSLQQQRIVCFSATSSASAAATNSASATTLSSLKRKLLGEEAIIPCQNIPFLSAAKNHPNVQAMLPVLGNVAYIGIASGFLMTDMFQLRLLLTVGYTGLVTYHILRPVPLRIPLRWSALFILLNAGAAALLWVDQFGLMAPFTDDDLQLYQEHFSILTKGQFHRLLAIGTRVELQDKTVLTEEGVPCPYLYFLEKGHAVVYHHKDSTAQIEPGGFVNDVAFQRGGRKKRDNNNKADDDEGAYGTVVVNLDLVPVASSDQTNNNNRTTSSNGTPKGTALVWKQDELRQLLKKNKTMEQNFKYILNDHLVKSLLRQRKAAHLRQQQNANAAAVGATKEKLRRAENTSNLYQSGTTRSL